MRRYRSTYPLDEPDLEDGDAQFIGVNQRLSPSQLPPGYVADAVNVRFDRGRLEPRKGTVALTWSNNYDGDDQVITPYGAVHGVGVFSDPNDTEWVMVCADSKCYRTREGMLSKEVDLPAGVSITGPVTFTQCVSQLIMFRGDALAPLILDDVDVGWKAINPLDNLVTGPASENPYDGTEDIPNAEAGVFLQNRLFIPYERDLVAASDYLNVTRCQAQIGAFRINQGSADKLVALAKFNETTLVAFKEQSVYRVTNVYGNLEDTRLDEITRQFGCRARKSIVQAGRDMFFLADKHGVVSITQTDQDKLQTVDLPLSEPIQPLIASINWDYADNACAAVWDNKLYLAVPVGDATVERDQVVPAGATFTAGAKAVAVTAGRTYWFEPGTNEWLVNGTQLLTSRGQFTAAGSTVTLRVPDTLFSDDFESEVVTPTLTADLSQWDIVRDTTAKVDILSSTYSDDVFPLGIGVDQGFFLDLLGTASPPATQGTLLRTKSYFPLESSRWYHVRLKLAGSQRASKTVVQVRIVLSADPTVVAAFMNVLLFPDEPFKEYSFDYYSTSTHNVKLEIKQISWQLSANFGSLVDDVALKIGKKDDAGYAVASTITNTFIGVNNTILVYDFLNRAWAGKDVWAADADLMVQDFFSHTLNGVRRLFCVTNDGFIFLLEEGLEDDVVVDGAIESRAIETTVTTRGYSLGTHDRKRWKRLTVDAETWAPQITVSAQTDAGESIALETALTRSRSRYDKPFYAEPYDTTNANEDHDTDNRGDYSIALGESDELVVGTAGVDPERLAPWRKSWNVARSARSVQLTLSNAAGRININGISAHASPGARAGGTT